MDSERGLVGLVGGSGLVEPVGRGGGLLRSDLARGEEEGEGADGSPPELSSGRRGTAG